MFLISQQDEDGVGKMKSIIKRIVVLFCALAVMGVSAATVWAGDTQTIGPDRPGWPPPIPGPWTRGGKD